MIWDYPRRRDLSDPTMIERAVKNHEGIGGPAQHQFVTLAARIARNAKL
jgi:hypothetical protein